MTWLDVKRRRKLWERSGNKVTNKVAHLYLHKPSSHTTASCESRHPALIFPHFSYFPSRDETQLLHCATQYSISHSAHFCQRKDAVLCWGIWHHDKYALDDEGEGWSGVTVKRMDFSMVIGLAYCKQRVISVSIIIPGAWIKGKQIEESGSRNVSSNLS